MKFAQNLFDLGFFHLFVSSKITNQLAAQDIQKLPYSAIQQTEIYEYAKLLGGEPCIVPFQAVKLFYAKEVFVNFSFLIRKIDFICRYVHFSKPGTFTVYRENIITVEHFLHNLVKCSCIGCQGWTVQQSTAISSTDIQQYKHLSQILQG